MPSNILIPNRGLYAAFDTRIQQLMRELAGLTPTSTPRRLGSVGQSGSPGESSVASPDAPGSGTTGPASPTPSITGFDPSLANLGLGFLGGLPGSPFGMASKAMALAQAIGATPPANLVDQQGNPVQYTGPKGLTGLLASIIGIGKPPSFTVTP